MANRSKARFSGLDVTQALVNALQTIDPKGRRFKVAVDSNVCAKRNSGRVYVDDENSVVFLPFTPTGGITPEQEDLLRVGLAHELAGAKHRVVLTDKEKADIANSYADLGASDPTSVAATRHVGYGQTTVGFRRGGQPKAGRNAARSTQKQDAARALLSNHYLLNGTSSARINARVVETWPGYEVPIRLGWRAIFDRRRQQVALLRKKQAEMAVGGSYEVSLVKASIKRRIDKVQAEYDQHVKSKNVNVNFSSYTAAIEDLKRRLATMDADAATLADSSASRTDRAAATARYQSVIKAEQELMQSEVEEFRDAAVTEFRKRLAKRGDMTENGYYVLGDDDDDGDEWWGASFTKSFYGTTGGAASRWSSASYSYGTFDRDPPDPDAEEPTMSDYGAMVGAAVSGYDMEPEAGRFAELDMMEHADMAMRVAMATKQLQIDPERVKDMTDKQLRRLAEEYFKILDEPPEDNSQQGSGEGEGEGGGEGDEQEDGDGEGEGQGQGQAGQDGQGQQPSADRAPSISSLMAESKSSGSGQYGSDTQNAALEEGDKQGGGPDARLYQGAVVYKVSRRQRELKPLGNYCKDNPTWQWAMNVEADASVVAQTLRQAIKAPTMKDDSRHQIGRFDVRQIARAKSGNRDIFSRRTYLPGEEVSVGLLVDISGSMNDAVRDADSSIRKIDGWGLDRATATGRTANVLLAALDRNGMQSACWLFTNDGSWMDLCHHFLSPEYKGTLYEKNLRTVIAESGITTVQHGLGGAEYIAGQGAGLLEIKAFNDGKAVTKEAMATLAMGPSNGGTPLDEALDSAVNMMARQETHRKVLFLLTDGGGGHQDRQVEIIERAAKQGVEIIAVALDMGEEAEEYLGHFPTLLTVKSDESIVPMARELAKILLRHSRR